MDDAFTGFPQDRFLKKDPNQNDQTKGAVYTAGNPAPKRGDDSLRKQGRPAGSEEDDGAPNILTGTVIVSCFIQTSALPSRIEMQGNDLTFFDDTEEHDGVVSGDTSRLIFTHASGKSGEKITEGYIWEKRASTHDTYDNVLSLYALRPKIGRQNYMYFGRDGRGGNNFTNYIEFNVNYDPLATTNPTGNGAFVVGGTTDGATSAGAPNFAVIQNDLVGVPGSGYSVFLSGRDSGIIIVNSSIFPLSGGIDLGGPANKFGTFYGAVVACPLPTIEGSALEMLKNIAPPVPVGERGHYGDGLYYDDLTFPAELLYTDTKGRTEIEHTKMIGFLLQALIELSAEVETLKKNSQGG